MKFFALVFVIFAVTTQTLSLKHHICGLEHSKTSDARGISCLADFPSYTYKMDTNECIRFTYGGCFGNANRFWTQEECEDKCKE